ncbi:MAG TPA: hypothetical protein VMG41_17435 [Gemmatimonadales bacterium]|nr:hypothetical protein [Gemmatimonadales bacterium]
MRFLTFALACGTLLPSVLSGQGRYSLTVTGVAGTHLVTDQIFQSIKITQLVAPTLTLGGSLPVSPHQRMGIEIALGSTKTRVLETGYPTTEGPAFRTLSVTLGFEGPILSRFTYRAGAGLLKYMPDHQGIFLQGGPLLLVLTGGLDYHYPLHGGLGLLARARYDYQRFTTDQLQAIGFSRTQDVHRVGIGLGIEYQRP